VTGRTDTWLLAMPLIQEWTCAPSHVGALLIVVVMSASHLMILISFLSLDMNAEIRNVNNKAWHTAVWAQSFPCFVQARRLQVILGAKSDATFVSILPVPLGWMWLLVLKLALVSVCPPLKFLSSGATSIADAEAVDVSKRIPLTASIGAEMREVASIDVKLRVRVSEHRVSRLHICALSSHP